MSADVYAVHTPQGWQVATKVKASAYGHGVPNVPGEALVWSQLYTTGWLCKVGEELASVRLDMRTSDRENYEAICAMRNDLNELLGNMESPEGTLLKGPELSHDCEVVVGKVRGLRERYDQACERLLDVLKQDDGEAFFEAEKFLKAHRPDLYNRIGTDPDQPDMFKENKE